MPAGIADCSARMTNDSTQTLCLLCMPALYVHAGLSQLMKLSSQLQHGRCVASATAADRSNHYGLASTRFKTGSLLTKRGKQDTSLCAGLENSVYFTFTLRALVTLRYFCHQTPPLETSSSKTRHHLSISSPLEEPTDCAK